CVDDCSSQYLWLSTTMLGTFEPVMPYDFAVDEALVTAKYQRASKLVTSVFNKYHNGSHRAVDTVVVSALLQEEDALFGLQCLVEQGPAAICRERKERKWDMLGDISKLTAMQEYIELLNKLLPGWDDQSEFPLQLSAGAPARPARVCATCKAAIDNDKGLLEVRRLLHENRELKVRIQTIAQDTDSTVNAQLAVAATLRTDAIAQGCNMLAVDKSIQSKWREDNPALDLHVKTPPAHKFRVCLPQFWMWRACHDPDTHKYVCDLAEAVTSHLGGASAADEDSDEALHWSSIMLKASPTWSEAYALVVAKCGENGCLEHDKQILAD
ncbi:hypothetical protein DYB28_012149, partial [Aphanomyces astaci]